MEYKIAHIINPVKMDNPASDLLATQVVVFESMLRAKAEFSQAQNLRLLTVQYPEDHAIIPQGFEILPDLKRSAKDIPELKANKKLPFIADILAAAYQHADADYYIFTNVDIVLMPFFYEWVLQTINKDATADAFVINRRRISKKFLNGFDLAQLYAEVGKSHPGFDCFVFKKTLVPKLILDNICVGIPFLEASLMYNLIAHSQHLQLFSDKHLTLHIGMEVMPKRNQQLYWHNRNTFFKKIYPQLKPNLKFKNLPYSLLPLWKRWLYWGLNPALFTLINIELEAKGWKEKLRLFKDEIRFDILQKD